SRGEPGARLTSAMCRRAGTSERAGAVLLLPSPVLLLAGSAGVSGYLEVADRDDRPTVAGAYRPHPIHHQKRRGPRGSKVAVRISRRVEHLGPIPSHIDLNHLPRQETRADDRVIGGAVVRNGIRGDVALFMARALNPFPPRQGRAGAQH